MLGLKSKKSAPADCRVIYRSPYGGGTEVSKRATREQCMTVLAISLARGWLRQGKGRTMLVVTDAEYQRVHCGPAKP